VVHGDQVTAVELRNAEQIEHWYFIAGIDIFASSSAVSVVVLGDSITDGHGATTNRNDRWPDFLARRLQAVPQGRSIAILNHGIGGNRLLLDGLGPNALARFNDDVIAQAGARSLIVLEGINDIGMLGRTGEATAAEHEQLVSDIIGAYLQIIERAHTHGITVSGCTILPFAGSDFYHPGAANEADRQMVNRWIRTPGHFDAVIDFDQVMRDPASPDHLLPRFDSGDHLHPSPAGYAAMADAVPLAFLMSPKGPGRMRPTTAPSAASHH
jgi:lysophospholipase L1-like esterase